MASNRYKKFSLVVSAVVFCMVAGIFLFNFIVDPFNANELFNLGLDKQVVSTKINYRLYKGMAYTRHPAENIILGDSRVDGLDTNFIQSVSGEHYFNYGYGGASAYEIFDTFWNCVPQTKLKKVYIGLNFNLYNAENKINLVPEAQKYINSKELYYLSHLTTKTSYFNVYYKIFHANLANENPNNLTKEQFWKKQLSMVREFYGIYVYPSEIEQKLREIKQYCDRNGIEMVIFIPPTHVDLQNTVDKYHLRTEYSRYKRDLASITTTIDFDYPNEWTTNYELFNDPYHPNEILRKKVIDELWGGKLLVGRVVMPE